MFYAVSGALAFTSSLSSVSDYSGTIGTVASACVPANARRATLLIENPVGNTNNICYSFSAGVSCSGPGNSILVPGASDFWPLGSAPLGPIYCVASGAGTAVTIREQE